MNNVRKGLFVCVICNECAERRSNVQKYCDDCRLTGRDRTMAKYYRDHSSCIKKQQRERNKKNKEAKREYNRLYYQIYVKSTSREN